MIRRALLCISALVLPLTIAINAEAQPAQPVQAQPAQPQPAPTAPSATANPYGGMQTGGLAPPPPMATNQPPPQGKPTTSARLDEAKEKDAGRGLEWFWINAEGGFQHVGLQTFNIDEQNFTAGFIPTEANGAMVGAGLGLRLIFFTLGARGRVGFFPDWQMFSVGPELGFHIPLGRVEPHVEFGGGYVALGNVEGAVQGAADAVSIRGFYVRATGGLDVYLTPVLSLGLGVSWEMLGMTRPGVDPTQIANIKSNPSLNDLQRKQADLLALEGTSYGSAIAATGVVGLHF